MTMSESEHHDALHHADRMELRQLELDAETKRIEALNEKEVRVAKERTKQDRAGAFSNIGIALVVGAVLLGIVFAIYKGTTGPEGPDPETDREKVCMDHGGTWLPADVLGDTADKGLCVMPGQDVSK